MEQSAATIYEIITTVEDRVARMRFSNIAPAARPATRDERLLRVFHTMFQMAFALFSKFPPSELSSPYVYSMCLSMAANHPLDMIPLPFRVRDSCSSSF